MKRAIFMVMVLWVGCGNPCGELKQQCKDCISNTLTSACDVIANAGVADACMYALDQKTYSGNDCKNRCPELAPMCAACGNMGYREACQRLVDNAQYTQCGIAIDSKAYASDSVSCTQP